MNEKLKQEVSSIMKMGIKDDYIVTVQLKIEEENNRSDRQLQVKVNIKFINTSEKNHIQPRITSIYSLVSKKSTKPRFYFTWLYCKEMLISLTKCTFMITSSPLTFSK